MKIRVGLGEGELSKDVIDLGVGFDFSESAPRNNKLTYVVLSPAQLSHWDLVCALRSQYPNVQIIAQTVLETQT